MLVVSGCLFLGEGGLFQGLSLACFVGLLLFVKWSLAAISLRKCVFSGLSLACVKRVFCTRVSHFLVVVSGCHFFAQVDISQGMSLACLFGPLFFVKLFPNLLVVCGCHAFLVKVGLKMFNFLAVIQILNLFKLLSCYGFKFKVLRFQHVQIYKFSDVKALKFEVLRVQH